MSRRHGRARRAIGLAATVMLLGAGAAAIAVALNAAAALHGGHPAHRERIVAAVSPGIALSRHRPASPAQSSAEAYRAVQAVLRYTPYVRTGSGRRREIALTFDDGPGPYTGAIIRILRRMQATATFFAIGHEVHLYPREIAAEVRAGFEIGDHTEIHPFMAALSPRLQQAQLVEAARAIHAAGAPTPALFRPPYGSFDAATLRILPGLHMLMVLWTVDTSDYSRPGVARIVYVALSGARPGAIILMHDGGGDRLQTVAALPRIILGLRRHGYRLVTISQLVADDPPPRHQPLPTPLSGAG